MTEETYLTAKSFQKAFITVKGIFLLLSMCFQVLSALLFFKMLGGGRNNSKISIASVFSWLILPAADKNSFICKTNLIDARVYLTAAAQMPRSLWNIKKKRAQLHCIIIKGHMLEYLWVLDLLEADRTDPWNPCKEVGRSGGFQTLRWLCFDLVDWQTHFRLCETQTLLKSEALFQFWPSNVVCAFFLQDLSEVCYESSQEQVIHCRSSTFRHCHATWEDI